MREAKELLRAEIHERLIPMFVARGFVQRSLATKVRGNREMAAVFPFGHLKRWRGRNLDLIDIQLHEQKAKFVVNFGASLPEGTTFLTRHVDQDEASVADLREQCRLYSSRRFMRWFGPSSWPFSKITDAQIATAVSQAINLSVEVDQYFYLGVVGPHVKCLVYDFSQPGKISTTVRS